MTETPSEDRPQDTVAPSNGQIKILTLAEIAEVEDITEETVPVPQWGGGVVVRSITHRQMNALRAESAADPEGGSDEEKLQKYLLKHAMVQPNITTMEEVEILWGKSSAAIVTILQAIMANSKLNMKVAVKESERQFPEGQQ